MVQPPINFAATPASITADAERLVKESKHRRDELVRNIAPEQATFANVMLPLAQIQNDFTVKANVLAFYRHVSADVDIRAASAKAQTLFDSFNAECWMREDIFKLVDVVYHNINTEEISKESSSFLETIYNKSVQSGLGIRDAVSRERFKEIQGRLSQIHAEFRENLGSPRDEIFLTLDELDGVPESTIKLLENNSSNNTFRIDLSNSRHRGILWSAEKSETRRNLYLAIENRCKENAPLVQEAVRLRYEMAKLLGFANYAAFQLQSRMAKTPERVNEFLADLRSKLTPYGVAALRELQDFKKSVLKDDENNGEFFLWDDDFYRSRMVKSRISIDRTRIKEYFPLQNTITALLNLLAQLFGLSFDEIKADDSMVWHADVQMFAVHDNETRGGGFLGYLYLDLFGRDGKYPGQSCFSLQPVSISYLRSSGDIVGKPQNNILLI
jgi:metallopeptidase MepB